MAPVLLLYPVGLAAEVEYLPGGWPGPSRPRAGGVTVAALAADGSIVVSDRQSVITLFGDHRHVLAELSQALATRGAP